MQATPNTILALDVGDRRIGAALANSIARLAQPLTTLEQSEHIMEDLQRLVRQERVDIIVVGLPRGLEGQTTAQTRVVQAFAKQLQSALGLPIVWQDEALTSVQAEAELADRHKAAAKADIDALAATYILEDYLKDHTEAANV